MMLTPDELQADIYRDELQANMIGFGLLMNVYIHRDTKIGRRWDETTP